jgi:hypothetical protein
LTSVSRVDSIFWDLTTGEAPPVQYPEPVDVPPKISDTTAKVVPVEVLPPEPEISQARQRDPAPIHALSALILAAVDSLWALFEFAPPLWILTIPLCFFAVFVPTYFIQRHLKHDSAGRALAFASVLGVLAALPTPIMGTPVGLGLLAWTGLGKLFGKSSSAR